MAGNHSIDRHGAYFVQSFFLQRAVELAVQDATVNPSVRPFDCDTPVSCQNERTQRDDPVLVIIRKEACFTFHTRRAVH